jgi:hypothetical protein
MFLPPFVQFASLLALAEAPATATVMEAQRIDRELATGIGACAVRNGRLGAPPHACPASRPVTVADGAAGFAVQVAG